MLIRCPYYVDTLKKNVDDFSHCFNKLFCCKFDKRKVDILLTYFIQHNFDARKIYINSMCFLPRNFDEPKLHVVSMWFFDAMSMNIKLTHFRRVYFHVLDVFFDILPFCFNDKTWWLCLLINALKNKIYHDIYTSSYLI